MSFIRFAFLETGDKNILGHRVRFWVFSHRAIIPPCRRDFQEGRRKAHRSDVSNFEKRGRTKGMCIPRTQF